MKRDKTALKMICNQWVGSSNLSSGTTHQGFQLSLYFTKLSGLHICHVIVRLLGRLVICALSALIICSECINRIPSMNNCRLW